MDWEIRDGSKVIPNFSRYISLKKNWSFSSVIIQKIIEELEKNKHKIGDSAAIGVAGSLGRFEASDQSDLDTIVIVDNKKQADIIRSILSQVAEKFDLEKPKPGGLFSEASSIDDLVRDIGSFTDELGVLGRRMLLLLETFPIYNSPRFIANVETVYERYSEYLRQDNNKQFAFLTNDLIRYFRSICVNYQNTFWRENEKWPIRNIKLRHSRIVMYCGLLFTLGVASKSDDKIGFVRKRLSLTPLERIAAAYKDAEDDCFFRVAGCYDNFLSKLSDSNQRVRLSNLDYDRRYDSELFSELKHNSDALIAELLRFAYNQRGRSWSDRFYEYLFF